MNIDTTPWGGKPIEEYAIWEQREILSCSTLDNSVNIDTIVDNFLKDQLFDWSHITLQLVDEACIQQALRENGYEIRCYELNVFPTSVTGLKQDTEYVGLPPAIKPAKIPLLAPLYNLITDVLFLELIIAIVGIIYYHADLLGVALFVSWIVCNFTILILHDTWAHRCIRPKNKYVGYMLNSFGYLMEFTAEPISWISPRLVWPVTHNFHHNIWPTEENDRATWALNWIPYLFLTVSENRSVTKLSNNMVTPASQKYLTELDPVLRFIDDNYRWLVPLVHISLMAIIGIHYYFYFVFLQIWIHGRFKRLFADIIPHFNKKPWHEETDSAWLLPICTQHAYHITHHKLPGTINFGPGKLKYINIQYYFVKLFYNIDAKII